MSAATRAKTAKERATIAIRMMKTNKSGSFGRSFDDCFEMGDSDQVVACIAHRATCNSEILELTMLNRGVAWSYVKKAILQAEGKL